jgi:hypothetical protein
MRFFAHLCVCAAVAVTLLSLVNLRFVGRSDLSQLLFELRRSETLQHRIALVAGNMEIKQAIVADIVAGRLSLREAAVRFQEANCLVENNDPDLLPAYQIPATEEGVCQQVLAWMRAEVALRSPERAKRILAPLEKEYESRFGPLESAVALPACDGQ